MDILLLSGFIIGAAICLFFLAIFLHFYLTDIHYIKGYADENKLKKYFYKNRKIFDNMEVAALSIINTEYESEDSIAQKYMKRSIESLSVRLRPKPENNERFAVYYNEKFGDYYAEKNEFWINMGVYCAWMGDCSHRGYLWRLTPIDNGNEWTRISDYFSVRKLSERWYIYIYFYDEIKL